LEEEEEEEGVEAPLSAVDDAKEDAAPLEAVKKKVTRQKNQLKQRIIWQVQAHHEQEGFKKAEPLLPPRRPLSLWCRILNQ
jgi:hypothetical protein